MGVAYSLAAARDCQLFPEFFAGAVFDSLYQRVRFVTRSRMYIIMTKATAKMPA